MGFVHGRVVGAELCRALGLDPERVRGVAINAPLDSVATATVTFYPQGDEVEGLIKKYHFVEAPES